MRTIRRILAYRRAFTGNIFGWLHSVQRRPELRRYAVAVGMPLAQGRVLDVGPGPATLLIELALRAPRLSLYGLELDPEMIAEAESAARKLGVAHRLTLKQGVIEKAPFDTDYFDVVVSTFSLQMWKDPESGLAEVFRMLRPGGELHLRVGPGYFIPSRWLRIDWPHHRSRLVVAGAVGYAGFDVQSAKYERGGRLNVVGVKPVTVIPTAGS